MKATDADQSSQPLHTEIWFMQLSCRDRGIWTDGRRILVPYCTHVSRQLIIFFPSFPHSCQTFHCTFCLQPLYELDNSTHEVTAAQVWTQPEKPWSKQSHPFQVLVVGCVAQILQETGALVASEKQWEHTILHQKISAWYPHACRQSKQTLFPHLKPHDPAFSFPSLHMVPAGHLACVSFCLVSLLLWVISDLLCIFLPKLCRANGSKKSAWDIDMEISSSESEALNAHQKQN